MHVEAGLIAARRRETEVVVTASVATVPRVVTVAATGGLQQRLKSTGAARTRHIRRVVVVNALVVSNLVVVSVHPIQNVSIRTATMVPNAASSCAGAA